MSAEDWAGDDEEQTPEGSLALLRSNALPAKDGSGVVFPSGFYGPGYHLEDWQFLRYVMAQGSVADDESKTREDDAYPLWKKILIILAAIAALILIGKGLAALGELGLISESGVWATLLALAFVYLVWNLYAGFVSGMADFRVHYPSARKLPYFRHWEKRVIADFVFYAGNWLSSVWSTALWMGLLFIYVWTDFFWGELHWIFATLGGVCFFFELSLALAKSITYRRVHDRLGRAPTAQDMETL